jgi:hypothetical protein
MPKIIPTKLKQALYTVHRIIAFLDFVHRPDSK